MDEPALQRLLADVRSGACSPDEAVHQLDPDARVALRQGGSPQQHHGPDHLGLDSILRSAPGDWWHGGQVPILIVQPLEDALGPPKVGRDLSARLGSRARYVELADCGHAILPEQPDAVADHVIRFLRQHNP